MIGSAACAAPLLLASPAWSDFDQGVGAHMRGDYDLALDELSAVRGNVVARRNVVALTDKMSAAEMLVGRRAAGDCAENLRRCPR